MSKNLRSGSRSSNFRLTNQRTIILEYIKDNYSHPAVENIFNFVKEKLPHISKKTVYNNLKFLSEKGLIKELMLKGVRRYEPALKPHHHMICMKCGKITDLVSDDLTEHAMRTGKKVKDFDMKFIKIIFYGICNDCKEAAKNGRKE